MHRITQPKNQNKPLLLNFWLLYFFFTFIPSNPSTRQETKMMARGEREYQYCQTTFCLLQVSRSLGAILILLSVYIISSYYLFEYDHIINYYKSHPTTIQPTSPFSQSSSICISCEKSPEFQTSYTNQNYLQLAKSNPCQSMKLLWTI